MLLIREVESLGLRETQHLEQFISLGLPQEAKVDTGVLSLQRNGDLVTLVLKVNQLKEVKSTVSM